VQVWRKPDRTFSGQRVDLDLGGRVVQLWHFGTGKTPGDTIVYEPQTKTAWTAT
jgi:cyclase